MGLNFDFSDIGPWWGLWIGIQFTIKHMNIHTPHRKAPGLVTELTENSDEALLFCASLFVVHVFVVRIW